jgi:peptide/nickel transport system substrate-binding protein
MSNNYWNQVLTHRIGRRRALTAAGGLAASTAFLAACGGGSDNHESTNRSSLLSEVRDETKDVKRGGVYKGALQIDIYSVEPQSLTGGTVSTALGYSGLFREKDGVGDWPSGEIIGDVAQSWEMSPDKLTMTIKVNPGAHFAPVAPVNGRSIDAHDVAFSWERFARISSRRSDFSNQANKNAPISSVQAIDASTVQIKLAFPYAPILGLLGVNNVGTFYQVPKEAADTKVLDVSKTLLGTGPFYLHEQQPSVRATFKKNPQYKQRSGDLPYFDQIDFAVLTEYAAAIAQFKAGNIHQFATRAEDMLQLKQDMPDIQVVRTPATSGQFRVAFGNRPDSPFKDERVRHAYVRTWDRDAALDVIFNISNFEKSGLPVDSYYEAVLTCSFWKGWFLNAKDEKAFGPNAKNFKQDIGEAKKLMAAAGYANGLSTTVHFPVPGLGFFDRTNPMMIQMPVESQLFKIKQEPHPWAVDFLPNFFTKIDGNYDGIANSFLYTFADPVYRATEVMHSSGSLYSMGDSTIEDLITKAQREFDNDKRKALIQDVQKYEGGKMFMPRLGGATGFATFWPAVRNWGAFVNTTVDYASVYLDQQRPPFKKA